MFMSKRLHDFLIKAMPIDNGRSSYRAAPMRYVFSDYQSPQFAAILERVNLPAGAEGKLYPYTILQGETAQWISEGYHYVNREGHIFATVPVELKRDIKF